jgi:hypothetical protein
MVGEGVLIGAATLVGVAAFIYGIAYVFAGGQILHGVRKRFFCDGKQRVVDVDFVEVNRNMYDVASCTAFREDQNISCDKHCVHSVREQTLESAVKGGAPIQEFAPQPVLPRNGR